MNTAITLDADPEICDTTAELDDDFLVLQGHLLELSAITKLSMLRVQQDYQTWGRSIHALCLLYGVRFAQIGIQETSVQLARPLARRLEDQLVYRRKQATINAKNMTQTLQRAYLTTIKESDRPVPVNRHERRAQAALSRAQH